MKWVFPEVKTTRTLIEQSEKVKDEVKEYQQKMSDDEAVDVLHAAETLVRKHFAGREADLEKMIHDTIIKNFDRGYYSSCY